MNELKKIRLLTLGAAVGLWVGTAAQALTLGRAQGVVLLGKELSLRIPVQLEASDIPSASGLCAGADVFYGETRADPASVTVQTFFQAPENSAELLITGFQPIDEPIVSVYLRAGCDSRTSRRYVLLVDPERPNRVDAPTLSEAPRSAANLPRPEAVPVWTSAIASQAARGESAVQTVPPGASAPRSPQAEPVSIEKSASAKPARFVTPPAKPSDRVQGSALVNATNAARRGPYLKLAPVDLAIDYDPVLKFSANLMELPVENLERRAWAVAQWRALNPELEVSEARARTLAADMQGLQATTEKNQRDLLALAQRLEQAQSQRLAHPLVYGFLALIVVVSAGLVAMVYYLRRRATPQPWWEPEPAARPSRHGALSNTNPSPILERIDEAQAQMEAALLQQEGGSATERAAVGADLDAVDILLEDGGSKDSAVPAGSERATAKAASADYAMQRAEGHLDFAHSMTSSLRAMNTQEMLDVRQQAEFFVTLGQHDSALTLLKEHIEASDEANPLIYLDLLRLVHTLGRKPDFDYYRAEFRAQFSGLIPTYETYPDGGRSLDAYPDVCARLAAHWPSEVAIDVIESCLMRTETMKIGDGFDLEAFQDLLLLHAVASRVLSTTGSGFLPFSAARSEQPVRALHPALQASAESSQSGEDLRLDLDLSTRSGESLLDFEPNAFAQPANATDLLLQPGDQTPSRR